MNNNENTDIFYDEEDCYNDYYGGFLYYDADFDDCDGDGVERVKDEQLSVGYAMSVFEGFLEDGRIVDTDGKEYEILFVHESSDGSCVYLKFTDNEVIENRIIMLTAKFFPDISETTLFPLTEWEDVALRMEQLKRNMYDDA